MTYIRELSPFAYGWVQESYDQIQFVVGLPLDNPVYFHFDPHDGPRGLQKCRWLFHGATVASEVVSIASLWELSNNAPDFLLPHVHVAIATEGASLLFYVGRHYYEAHVHVGIESALHD
eukprot:UN04423